MSLRLIALDLFLRFREKPYLAREKDFVAARLRMEHEARLLVLPPGAVPRPEALGPVPALRVGGPDGAPTLFWLHGGAYCLGSGRTHVAMVAALAARFGASGVVPEYRLAPEHPFPNAVEDVRLAWDALRAEGVAPERIVLGGDSAGGGLAFGLLDALLRDGQAPPACVIAFSPWVDLTGGAQSLRTLARRDALVPVARFAEIREIYLGGADPRDPRASPRFGSYSGAPPVLIQSSRAEVLRDDARAMAARLRAAAVDVRLDERDSVPHVWQLYQAHLAEADAALDRAAAFARASLG
jgi:epsilon-lactone hydrolase